MFYNDVTLKTHHGYVIQSYIHMSAAFLYAQALKLIVALATSEMTMGGLKQKKQRLKPTAVPRPEVTLL